MTRPRLILGLVLVALACVVPFVAGPVWRSVWRSVMLKTMVTHWPGGTLRESYTVKRWDSRRPTKHGTYIEWRPNGFKSLQTEYENGRVKLSTSWDETGVIKHQYLSDGGGQIIQGPPWLGDVQEDQVNTRTGVWTSREYHPNNTKKYEGKETPDGRIGIWRFWDEEGKLTGQYRHEDFKRVEVKTSPPWWEEVEGQVPRAKGKGDGR